MHPMLNVAIQAIRKAGVFILKQYEFLNSKNPSQDYINNFMYNTHKESNTIIKKIIRKFYPLHHIIDTNSDSNFYYHDENNYYNNSNNNIYWIIKSIDNNINFVKKFPLFSLSIAVQLKHHIEIGVIYDPIHNELFSACRGHGAQLNDYKIRVNSVQNPYGTTISLIFPFDQPHTTIDLIEKLYNKYIHIRCTGAITLDLAYVAVGRIDGCIIINSKKDNKLLLASSTLILHESGGLITDFNTLNNNNNNYISHNVIAGHPKIIKKILSIISLNNTHD